MLQMTHYPSKLQNSIDSIDHIFFRNLFVQLLEYLESRSSNVRHPVVESSSTLFEKNTFESSSPQARRTDSIKLLTSRCAGLFSLSLTLDRLKTGVQQIEIQTVILRGETNRTTSFSPF